MRTVYARSLPPALIILTLLFCGCSQAEIRTGRVLDFHAADGVPDDILEICENALRDVFWRELQLERAGPPPGKERQPRENPWTTETVEKAAVEFNAGLAVTANIHSCEMVKTGNDNVPRPKLVIEFFFAIPDEMSGGLTHSRRLDALRDNGAMTALERFGIAAEIAAGKFIGRLLNEFKDEK